MTELSAELLRNIPVNTLCNYTGNIDGYRFMKRDGHGKRKSYYLQANGQWHTTIQ